MQKALRRSKVAVSNLSPNSRAAPGVIKLPCVGPGALNGDAAQLDRRVDRVKPGRSMLGLATDGRDAALVKLKAAGGRF